jgi:hypothetical protein
MTRYIHKSVLLSLCGFHMNTPVFHINKKYICTQTHSADPFFQTHSGTIYTEMLLQSAAKGEWHD